MDDKEHTYFNDFPRMPFGLTVLPWVLWALIAGMVIGGVFYASKSFAGPVVRASQGDVTITIYDEPCKLQDFVSNLPHRATWKEGNKVFEGCAGPNPQLGVVVFYFKEDKSVAAVPMQLFERVQGV